MNILIAPNTFKESLNSVQVTECIVKGLKKAFSNITLKCSVADRFSPILRRDSVSAGMNHRVQLIKLPFADGGTGTCEILTKSLNGKFVKLKVSGPLPKQKVIAKYGIINTTTDVEVAGRFTPILRRNSVSGPKHRLLCNKTAIIELAEAAGLKLVPQKKRNPLFTTTKGVGELILDAINKGCSNIILGIGDSATIDCGIGALSVLGFKFLDKHNKPIELNCRGLLKLNKILPSSFSILPSPLHITIASDVTNPLTGPNGVLMFAKQKGATTKSYHVIANAVERFKTIVQKQFNINLDKIAGSGAAGGIGGAMKVLLEAEIKSGFDIIKKITNLEEKIKNCDLIITGEGKIDSQTLHGKTVKRIIDIAKKYHKPVICLAGTITDDAKVLYKHSVVGIYSILNSPMSLKDAIVNTPKLITSISESLGRTIFSLIR